MSGAALHGLDDLLNLARIDFAPLYARLDQGPEHAPDAVLDGDAVLARGDGSHHRRRAVPAA